MLQTLSFLGKRWQGRGGASLDALPLLSAHSVQDALSTARDLKNTDQFSLPSPPDLMRAVERMQKAVRDKEAVGVFGDYDCDGITAAALIVRCFKRRGVIPIVRLPHRIHDGYGLSKTIAEEWITRGIKLLITVDTGITAVEPIRMLQERGVDVIVVDHHHLQAELPPAFALLHPALTPGFAPPHPSGAGMAFLLVRALEGEVWEDMHSDRALAMMGTVADLVELKGVNRSIVKHGLLSLQSIESGPLAILRDSVGSRAALTSTDVAFRIAPRLNAAGRMDDPILALHAILRGGEHIEKLHQLNRLRQDQTENLIQSARKNVDMESPLIATASKDYPHGIVGLIAGSLTESTGRPSIVAAVDRDHATASLRSPVCYHVTEGLSRIEDLLISYGGHAQAAGCSFEMIHWKEIQERLASDIAGSVAPEALTPYVEIDARIESDAVSLPFVRSLRDLEPFGQGNPEPRFLLSGVRAEQLRRVGSEGNHLQARIAGHKAVGFRMGQFFGQLDGPLDIVCRVGLDTWNGKTGVQLFVEDARRISN